MNDFRHGTGGQHSSGSRLAERESPFREFFTRGLRTARRAISWSDAQVSRQEILQNSEFEHALIKWFKEANFRVENLSLLNVDERFTDRFDMFLRLFHMQEQNSPPLVFNNLRTRSQFAITVIQGNIFYIYGTIVSVQKKDGFEVKILNNTSKNFQEPIFTCMLNGTNGHAGETTIGLLVDSDAYLKIAAAHYRRYQAYQLIFERPELFAADSTVPEPHSIIDGVLQTDPTAAQLFYEGIKNVINGESGENAVQRIALAIMTGEINFHVFLVQHAAEENLTDRSLLTCAQLVKAAYGPTLINLSEVYNTAFNVTGEEGEPMAEASTEILARLLDKGVIKPDTDLETFNASELRASVMEILDQELSRLKLDSRKITFELTFQDIGRDSGSSYI